MKIKILLFTMLLFLKIAFAQNTQTFDWENAVVQFTSSATETKDGIYHAFYTTDGSQVFVTGDGVYDSQGISDKAVFNSQSLSSVFIDIGTEVDIQSIKVLGLNGAINRNWVFKPVRGVGSPVTQSVNGTTATTVNLNWTNVTRIEISIEDSQNAGLLDNFLVDTITYEVSTPCTINIPDANFKAALLANSDINFNFDSEIQCAEAASFEGTMDVPGESILDLTGIEEFVNLDKLQCGANGLTSLDVSSNTKLTGLFCSSNQLTSLDITSNVLLTQLSCSGNQLASLDVTSNVLLKELLCQFNPLTSIDLSSNTLLDKLFCWNNNLSALNIANGNNSNIDVNNFIATGNPNLTCVQVDDVAYSTANWTNIDSQTSFSTNCIPSCTVNITDANFKAALVADTTINTDGDTEISCAEASAFTGTINVTNQSISDLTGLEAFINITIFSCSVNSLTDVDVSNSTALEYLYCDNNPLLTSLNISNNNSLLEVYCQNSSLASLDVSGNRALTRLDCYNNSLTSLDVSNNTSLNTLYCSDNLLNSLNVANGNNNNIINFWFDALNNPNLTCIQVDDVTYSTTNWTNIDSQTSFSTNCSATASIIDNEFNSSITLYPNPIINSLNIDVIAGQKLKRVQVFNLLGEKVIESISSRLDFSAFTSGIYILKLENLKGKIATKKIIKK